jgi:hypothetical protein
MNSTLGRDERNESAPLVVAGTKISASKLSRMVVGLMNALAAWG